MNRSSLASHILSLGLVLNLPSFAQPQIWNGDMRYPKQLKERLQTRSEKIKSWAKHINDGGLDTNFTYVLSICGRLNTNGWSGGLYFLNSLKTGRKQLWQVFFSEIKHEKETKMEYTGSALRGIPKGSAYIFGKINNVYTLQLGYGKELLLLPAVLDGNLSISLRYSGGLAIALLKPYYLNLTYVEYNPDATIEVRSERYSQTNTDHFLQPGFIQGRSSWSKGLSEIHYIPGLYTEFAIAIEADRSKAFTKTVTIGGHAALYTGKLVIMAEQKSYPYEASFFVGLALGKRWK